MSKRITFKESPCNQIAANRTPPTDNREQLQGGLPFFYCRRHDVERWLQTQSKTSSKGTNFQSLALVDLVENFVGGDNVTSRQSYQIGNHEIVVSIVEMRELQFHWLRLSICILMVSEVLKNLTKKIISNKKCLIFQRFKRDHTFTFICHVAQNIKYCTRVSIFISSFCRFIIVLHVSKSD